LDDPISLLVETKVTFNKEFSKPKSDSQSIIGFKEIMMRVEEIPWELDKRLKCHIQEANMQLIDS